MSLVMNLERALKIPGFTYDIELEWLAKQASTRHDIVEIGSWKGRSTVAMAMNTKGMVHAVDTWKGSKEDRHMEELKDKPEDWLKLEFLKNIEGIENINWIIGPSAEKAGNFRFGRKPPFDMIFIDGAHDYESVKADLLAWTPLLEPGGLLSGHDFDAGRPGVVKAVRELVRHPKMAGVGSIWYSGKLV